MTVERVQRMETLLNDALAPESIEIEDEGHLHVGHEGAKGGLGHFRLSIVSPVFNGKGRLARHRAVYAALGDMMQTDIHALTIEAVASDEF